MKERLQPDAGDSRTPDPRVKRVCLIFKTHLDLGFTDFAENVRQRYLREFFPKAIEVAGRLRRSDDRFVWTTGSFILDEALRQGDARRRRTVERAVRAGDLVWHATPFTTHTELLDSSLLDYGLGLSRGLDRRFGRVTRAGKFTDVPGHTIGATPALAASGIRLLHVGVNQASTPPDSPVLFRFGPDPAREILVLYEKSGYGAAQVWPDLGVALAFAHTGDNHGPPSAEQVHETYAELRRRFPLARITPGRLDDLAGVFWPLRRRLPAVREEIGDTWIHGAAADPWKIAAFRELSRLRRAWLQSGRMQAGDELHERFSRALLCVAEHTWGLDMKGAIGGDRRYVPAAFAQLRREKPARRLEQSWAEQRGYIRSALEALDASPLAGEARAALRRLRPSSFPDAPKSHAVNATVDFNTPHFRAAFDAGSGALRRLTAREQGTAFAGVRNPLGQVWFEVFSPADYTRFARQYLRMTEAIRWWAVPDFCKPGVETVDGLQHRRFTPTATDIEQERGTCGSTWRCWLSMPREAVERYGAPAKWRLTWVFAVDRPQVELTVDWFDKPASRIPQAIWCSFVPRLATGANWRFDKLGHPVEPRRVISRGNRRLHAVGDGGMTAFDAKRSIRIETLDAPLVAPGRASLLDFHQRLPSAHGGAHVNLYNNSWGTNFPLWYGENARFRFRLRFGPCSGCDLGAP